MLISTTTILAVLIVLLVSIACGIMIAFVARARHKRLRAEERRCIFVGMRPDAGGRRCCLKTKRRYQMRRARGLLEENWWKRCYCWYIFDICEAGHVTIISSNVRLFSRFKLVWRLLTNWSQFHIDQELFAKADETRMTNHRSHVRGSMLTLTHHSTGH